MTRPRSPQRDSFVRDRLPGKSALPVFLPLAGADGGAAGSGVLNCVSFLLDKHLEGPGATRIAIRSGNRRWTYQQLGDHVARMANVLRENHGIEPGNRVLLRGANSPEMAALWLAIQKIGAVAVVTMSLLRAGELATLIRLSQPKLALCDTGIADDLVAALALAGTGCDLLEFAQQSGPLFAEMALKSNVCETSRTLGDDPAIIAFTSGTTGAPKATVHFQRDILAICETVCAQIIRPSRKDVFIGTAPLAFTFGLGGSLIFPFYAGACTVLNGRYTAASYAMAIRRHRASVCFTVPTFYQKMLRLGGVDTLDSLRIAISSGEALPSAVRRQWQVETGVGLSEVLGATEMLHAFAGATGPAIKEGFIGPAIAGYDLAVLDDMGTPVASGTNGRLAVRGPTGCRYLNDARQADYVQDGWNLTGDICVMDGDGYVAYVARADDMIVSAGYNISGLEVENALLSHPDVAECAVIAQPDKARGQIVAGFVVPAHPPADPDALARVLQDHVQVVIAPYKYPRRITFVDALPRNESGKVQRFRLGKECGSA